MRTNCALLLADFFLYSYENEFLDNMSRSGHRRLARLFNLCCTGVSKKYARSIECNQNLVNLIDTQ